MPFPNNPENGTSVAINGAVYVYNSAKNAWIKNNYTGATLTANNLIITSNGASASTTSGALVVAGGAGIAGNVVAGAVYEGTSRVVTMSRSIAMSIVFGG